MGSASDGQTMQHAAGTISKFVFIAENHLVSTHRKPQCWSELHQINRSLSQELING
jgi:phosphoribosylcarboxyaminoimidazole (NCAIR) mutase